MRGYEDMSIAFDILQRLGAEKQRKEKERSKLVIIDNSEGTSLKKRSFADKIIESDYVEFEEI